MIVEAGQAALHGVAWVDVMYDGYQIMEGFGMNTLYSPLEYIPR